jgi:TPR repeat protein
MWKIWLFMFAVAFSLSGWLRAQETSSEEPKTRPNKQEILELMTSAGRLPVAQQDARMDAIRQNAPAGKSARTDFLFCMGLAYLDNPKAQQCVGRAYENGRGIVEDLSDAYGWYAVALENKRADTALRETIEADKERVKDKLLSAYPHPTEDELEDLARAQISRIAQYRDDLKRTNK